MNYSSLGLLTINSLIVYRKPSALAGVAKFLSIQKRCILFKAFTESQFKQCPQSPFRIPVMVKVLQFILDQVYLDQVYLDRVYLDHVYLDQVYLDRVYLDRVYLGQVYLDRVYLDQVYLDQVYLDRVYLDRVYLGQVYLDRVYLDQVSIRNIKSFKSFKPEKKNWKPKDCPCQLYKSYTGNLGFVNIFCS